MNQVLPGLIIALVMGAVTSAAVFAYRHPKAYERVSNPILKGLLWAFFISLFWNIAQQAARGAAIMGLPFSSEVRDMVEANITAIMIPGVYFLIAFLAFMYLAILQSLPALKKLDDEPPQKGGEEGPKKDKKDIPREGDPM